ncbi:MAG: hypothetical protein M3Y07_07865, partial [Acidobacteriota bacterium]|nr:hypothetical protein [Acidobacteriota bacterium]
SSDNRALLVFGPTRPASARMIALDPPSDVPFARRPHNVYQTHISHDGHWAAIQETGVGVLMAPVAGGKPHAPDSWKPLDLKRPI